MEWNIFYEVGQILIEMGGAGSGNKGHKGVKGQKGGSAPSGAGIATRLIDEVADEALKWLDRAIATSKTIPDIPSDEARAFLAETVEKESYKLYRGLGIVKHKLDPYTEDQVRELNDLGVGDKVPTFLTRQTSNISSYSTRLSVAKHYSREGSLRMIVEADAPKENIIAVVDNIPKVLAKHGISRKYTPTIDHEVVVEEPIAAVVQFKTGSVQKSRPFAHLKGG